MAELRGPVEEKDGSSQQETEGGGLEAKLWLWSSSEKLGGRDSRLCPRGRNPEEEEISRRWASQRSTEFSSPSWCPLPLGPPWLGQNAESSRSGSSRAPLEFQDSLTCPPGAGGPGESPNEAPCSYLPVLGC